MEEQFVIFRSGAEIYGVEIAHIREIIRPLDIIPVPGMMNTVEGIINLRGEILPVYKLANILGITCPDQPSDKRKSRIIILEKSEDGFGFLVDEVLEVVKVNREHIQSCLENRLVDSNEKIVSGVLQHGGKMVICLDTREMMTASLEQKENTKEHDENAVPI